MKVQSNNIQADPFGTKTFATNPPQKVVNPPVNGNSNINFNAKDPFGSMSGVPAQQKKQSNINDLWGGFSQNVPKTQSTSLNTKNNSVDFFNSFGNKPTEPVRQAQTNTVNFEEMFS